jgi:hypothetical protein
VGVVAANADALVIGFKRRPGGPSVLIAKGDVIVDEINNGLNTAPSEGGAAEERPGGLREAVGIAVTAAEQIADQAPRCR